jgi:phosphoheptose isomerase
MNIINFENFEFKLKDIINTTEWNHLQNCFNEKKTIISFGHGGNMAGSIHLSADISRLTDKCAFSPGIGTTITSIIGDVGFENWLESWLEIMTRSIDLKNTMIIGLSCSTQSQSSKTIEKALLFAEKQGIDTFLITAKRKHDLSPNIKQIVSDCIYYHTHELLSCALFYQLIYSYTNGTCPPSIKNPFNNLDNIICQTCDNGDYDHSFCENLSVPPNCKNDENNIAIDFDGVLHTFDRGYYDGTCYGEPIDGAIEAIKVLSTKYNVIIFSSKCLPDRPLVGGLTGKQLIINWLIKYDILKYIKDITHYKPRAKFYIDDKAICFTSWNEIRSRLI